MVPKLMLLYTAEGWSAQPYFFNFDFNTAVRTLACQSENCGRGFESRRLLDVSFFSVCLFLSLSLSVSLSLWRVHKQVPRGGAP